MTPRQCFAAVRSVRSLIKTGRTETGTKYGRELLFQQTVHRYSITHAIFGQNTAACSISEFRAYNARKRSQWIGESCVEREFSYKIQFGY